MEPTTRQCSLCKEVKDLKSFTLDKACIQGRKRQCRKCVSERARHRQMLRDYGITEAFRDSLVVAQGGCCAICGVLEEKAPRQRLAVDHCHETGKVRGMLCDHCNKGIGCLQDNCATLESAITYLKSHGHQSS